MKVLISQERSGHTETLAGFIQPFSRLGYDVSICSPDAYGNLSYYLSQGLKFDIVSEEQAIRDVAEGKIDVLVFNSGHLTTPEKGGPFSMALAREALAVMPHDRVLRLHHALDSARSQKEFVELGTSDLMAGCTDHVFTPYADLPSFAPDLNAPLRLTLMGGAYQGASSHRDLDKIRNIIRILDERDSRIEVAWFLTKAPEQLREAVGVSKRFSFFEGYSTDRIISEMNNRKTIMATIFKKFSRYHKQSLTGAIPFAVSHGIPLILDAELTSIYKTTNITLIEETDPTDFVSTIENISLQSYESLLSRIRDFRDHATEYNRNQLSVILGMAP